MLNVYHDIHKNLLKSCLRKPRDFPLCLDLGVMYIFYVEFVPYSQLLDLVETSLRWLVQI